MVNGWDSPSITAEFSGAELVRQYVVSATERAIVGRVVIVKHDGIRCGLEHQDGRSLCPRQPGHDGMHWRADKDLCEDGKVFVVTDVRAPGYEDRP